MSDAATSIDAYNAICEKSSREKRSLDAIEFENLLELMRGELIVSGNSPLLDIAYNRLPVSMFRKKYRPINILIANCKSSVRLSQFAAWTIVELLSKYMKNTPIDGDIRKLMPDLCRERKCKSIEADEIRMTMEDIDAAIPKYRREAYELYRLSLNKSANEVVCDDVGDQDVSKNTNGVVLPVSERSGVSTSDVADRVLLEKERQEIIEAAQKEASDIVSQASIEAEKQSSEIIDAAKECAEKSGKAIVDVAQRSANDIIGRARNEVEKKLSEAKSRLAQMTKDGRLQIYSNEENAVQGGFSAVREALLNTNGMIKRLENSISEATTQKVSSQLLELFNLIADTKDSAFDLARQNNNNDLETAAYNMDMFLDMIIEYMADYGIQTIASNPGERFSGKIHEVVKDDDQFDPRNSTIKVSKRSGFKWGEQVLQKEQVEL